MTSLAPVKAVLFDAYGTLFDVNGPVARLAGEIGRMRRRSPICGGPSSSNIRGCAA